MTEGIELTLEQVVIGGIRTKYDEDTKGMQTVFTLKTGTPVENIARIMNMQCQGAPMYCIFGSRQARMDLQIVPININTGEIIGIGTGSLIVKGAV